MSFVANKISLILTIFLVIQTVNVYATDIFNGTASIPPNGGEWYACSEFPTTYISFSIRVSNTSLNVTPNFIGTTVPGKNSSTSTPKYLPGVLAYQMTKDNVKSFTDHDNSSNFNYIPSLSCYEKPVQSCDQDVGDLPLSDNVLQCLAMENPTGQTVYFHVLLSFNMTVFPNNSFTSPDVPGGHESPNNNTAQKSGSNGLKPTSGHGFMQMVVVTLMVLGFSKLVAL
ncbi:7277_t:CDS:2 [Acaulospora morrowiae]|uniref:7277_t:CDS:1 n=1 Tax=Acaulospora morrowiae TaxID=94023 RepID=A0A9N9BZQ9_9GLOM|nr:7277_t:CDS:2 [Acaulospora morrowiae]